MNLPAGNTAPPAPHQLSCLLRRAARVSTRYQHGIITATCWMRAPRKQILFLRIDEMSLQKTFSVSLSILLLAVASFGQKQTTGNVKGRVRVDSGATAGGVTVIARQGESEIARAVTNNKGEFEIKGLAPGIYALTFRKPGLSVGTMEKIEVRAGKTRSLSDRLFLPIDEGSIAFIRGSVFTASGLIVPNARVELARLLPGGETKKLDGRITNYAGSFAFRLTPEAARYRITVKADGMETATKDIEVEGAQVYRVALSLSPAAK